MIIIKINYASVLPNVNITYDQTNVYAKVVYGTGGGITTVEWGDIEGTLSDQTDLQNALNAKQDDITLTTIGNSGASTFVGNVLNIPQYTDQYVGTVTSVNMSVPTGLTISGNPITSSGTLAVGLQSGYSIPTTANQANWTTAYNDSITSAAVTGTSTKTLTLNQQDGGTVTASWSDIDTGLTSVGLSMPVAFSVANTPLTANGTLAVSAIGTASQYIRGDGQLATFPSGASGGSSVNYYLNGSVNQGTIGGSVYYEMNRNAVTGAGTDFIRTNLQGNGLIAQFITDANDPNRLEIPGGAWNFEMYFSSSSSGGTPGFYIELLKYDGTTFTSIANGSTNPEGITGGTSTDLYLTSLAVPQTTLLTTDRLAIRVYVITSGKDITLHTEDNNLCEIITTFAGGIAALNGLTANTQYLAVGTSGTDFAISSVSDTHTFNLPTASATNRGALSSTDWTTFNNKQDALTLTTTGTSGAATLVGATLNIPQYQSALTNPVTGTGSNGQVAYFDGTNSITSESNLFWDATNNRLGIGTTSPTQSIDVPTGAVRAQTITVVAGGNLTSTATNTINVSQNLGIGLSGAATQRLDVAGSIKVYADGATGIFGSTSSGTAIYSITRTNVPNTGSLTINALGGFSVGVGNATSGNNYNLQLFNTGNLVLQNGGTFTDGGQRLQVQGSTLLNGLTTISGSTTAATAIARGANITSTLVAAANNDVLVGLDINPTYTVGAFTGVSRLAGRFVGDYVVYQNSVGNLGTGYAIEFATNSLTPRIDFVVNGSYTGSFQAATTDVRFVNNLNNTGTISFSTVTGGLASAARMRLFNNGNILIQNGGTFTDAGYRLDVNGTARVQEELTVNTVNIGLGGGAVASNTRVGTNALNSNTTGSINSSFGWNAMRGNTTGSENTAFGYQSGRFNISGGSNSSFGVNSLLNNTGSDNASFGHTSLPGITSGNSNTAIGAKSGRYAGTGTTNITSVNNSIFIGNLSRAANATGDTNEIVIGYDVVGNGSNTTTLGNASTTNNYVYGNFNIIDKDIIFGTTTGTKIGTATSQKLAFWNATPIVQPTTAIAEATFVENSGGTAVNVDSTFAGYTLQQIAQALKNMGILA